jgi:hypothetical protein
MSAWIVSKNHINAIVQGAITLELIPPNKATEVGKDLWKENHESIHYRYPNDKGGGAPSYAFKAGNPDLALGALLKALHCYNYQTWEHPDGKASQAKALTDKMEAKILTLKPSLTERDNGGGYESHDHDPDYTAAPWGID